MFTVKDDISDSLFNRLDICISSKQHLSALVSYMFPFPYSDQTSAKTYNLRQRIDYKLAVLTHKIRATSTPSYLSDHFRPRETTRQLRSSTMPLLHRPTTRTHFADRAFRCCAPSVWNSLDSETLLCSSISGFKRRLKTLLFRQTFSSTT